MSSRGFFAVRVLLVFADGTRYQRAYARYPHERLSETDFTSFAVGNLIRLANEYQPLVDWFTEVTNSEDTFKSWEGTEIQPERESDYEVYEYDEFDEDEYAAKYEEYERQANSFPIQEGRWS